MKRLRMFVSFIAFALIVPGIVFGQAKVGTTGVNFLKIGPTSRAVAMADAFIAIADDASGLYYNPAGMVNVPKRELVFSHVSYPAGINYDFVGGMMPLPAMGAAIGVSLTALYTDEMDVTTPGRPYGTGETFTASDFSAGVSYAQRLTDRFSVGGTLKYIQENLADEAAYGWAADVGTFYDTGWRSMRIAMMITNFGPDMKHVNTSFPLPMNFKFAIAADLVQDEENRLTMGIEATHPNDNVEEIHIGFEYGYREMAFIRLGKKINGWKRDSWDSYNEEDDNTDIDPYVEYPIIDENGLPCIDGFTVGGGLNIQRLGLTVDYAYANFGFLGSIHRFTLGYRFRR